MCLWELDAEIVAFVPGICKKSLTICKLKNGGSPNAEEEGFERIRELIDETLTSREFQEGIDRAKSEAWSHIGNSAALIADYLIRKEKELAQQQE